MAVGGLDERLGGEQQRRSGYAVWPRRLEALGFSSLVVTGGSIAGPVPAGLSFDTTGSYATGFTALALLAALGSPFIIFLPAPSLRAHST